MEEKSSVLRDYLEAILIAAIFLGFTNTFVVKTFYIPSGSMEDTLLIGDHLFVNRYIFGPQATSIEQAVVPGRDVRRGDIVIFRSPENPTTDLVKRCIGLPGDEIHIVDKELFLNGTKVEDAGYTAHSDPRIFKKRRHGGIVARDNFGPYKVPSGHYFFLGDNRDESNDSRFWGSVPRHLIKGRALTIYWSYGGKTPDGRWQGWGSKLAQISRTAAGFFTQTRWGRTFHLVR